MKTSEEILGIIVSNISKIVPDLSQENINRNAKLSPLGLDLVGKAELIEMTLEELNTDISRKELHIVDSIGELADQFASKLKSTLV